MGYSTYDLNQLWSTILGILPTRGFFIAASSQAILKLLKIKELNPNSIHIHRTAYCISYHFWSNIQTCFCCRFLFPAMNALEDHAFCFGEEVYYLSASNDWIPAVVEGHVMLNQKRHYNLNVQKAAEPNRVISKEQYQAMQHGHGQTPSQIFCFGEAVIWRKSFFRRVSEILPFFSRVAKLDGVGKCCSELAQYWMPEWSYCHYICLLHVLT